MRVLLDTYVLIRLTEDGIEALTPKTRALFNDPETIRLLSTISLTEIAIKRSIGKLKIKTERLQNAIDKLVITVIPYTEMHTAKLFDLPLMHKEPFDRMLIATALAEDVPLVSIDRQFPKYKDLKIIS